MKKLLIFSLLFITLSAQSQVRRIFGSSYFDIRTHRLGFVGGAAGDDTLAIFKDSSLFDLRVPLLFARWTTANRPASPAAGTGGFNTDSARFEYWDGSAWQQPGASSGGGGGTPGGSNTQLQYNNSGAFGGTSGLTWDNTNTGITLTKDALGVTPSATAGIILRTTTAATSGNQQIPPAWSSEGLGFASTPAASRPVRFLGYTLPIQGTTDPSGNFLIRYQINGGTVTTALTIGTDNSITNGSSATAGIFRLTTSTTNSYLSAGNRFDFVMNNAMSARASGTWTVVSGTTVIDPNTYTSALWNSISTTLPQFNAAYNTTNTTLFQTNSSGNHTITPSGGNLFLAATVGINTTGPDRRLDILDNAAAQLRLTHTDGSVYAEMRADGNGILAITPTGRYVSTPTGSTSNIGYVPNIIWSNYSTTATSGTGETDLYTYATPATTLGADGEWLEYNVEGIFNPGATVAGATMTARAYWAGTEVLEAASTSATAYAYVIKIRVVRTSSTNARVTAWIIGGGTSFTGVGSDVNPRVTNITTTFTNTNILKTTGQTTDGTQGLNVQAADIKWNPSAVPGS